MARLTILIVDDEPGMRSALRLMLQDEYETLEAQDGHEALEVVRKSSVDLVLLDVNLPKMDGIRTLERISQEEPDTGVIMVSAVDSAEKAVSALRQGAYDYITKPFDPEDLLSTIRRYTDRFNLKIERDYLKEDLSSRFGSIEMISRSAKMTFVFDLAKKVSCTRSNVLITGESGTGKELVARGIHSISTRSEKPFVAINCGAVPGELMESELFGHEKGAFTGAYARKIGRFEYADSGTLFLDEISTMPMHLQTKLLRVLQERSFERVGSNIPIRIDIRVIAATNVDLEEAVRKGSFRADLYYRLKVVPIELPPLKARTEDIPLLVTHFIKKHSRELNKRIRGMTLDALVALGNYPWPGNVRELENLIERLVVFASDGSEITCDDLPLSIFSYYPEEEYADKNRSESFREAVKSFERKYILGVLNKTSWNRNEAAKKMSMHRNTLQLKIKELVITKRLRT